MWFRPDWPVENTDSEACTHFSLEPVYDAEQGDTSRIVEILPGPSVSEEYSGCSTNILLGGTDGKLLVYSLIGLSLLGTNEAFIPLSDSAHTTLPYLASGPGMSPNDRK